MQPSSDISIHDNIVRSYEVDAVNKRICLHTEFTIENAPAVMTDVVFSDVEAYLFQHDTFDTILLDIYEVTFDSLFANYRREFEEGRPHCWPGTWNNSDDSIMEYWLSSGLKAYTIDSACGMSGWVLSQSMTFLPISRDK